MDSVSRYRHNLSHFGQSILDVLVKKYETEQRRKRSSGHGHVREGGGSGVGGGGGRLSSSSKCQQRAQPKVLTFEDCNDLNISMVLPDSEKTELLVSEDRSLSSVLSTCELVKPIEKNEISEDYILPDDVSKQITQNIYLDYSYRGSNSIVQSQKISYDNKAAMINWNDMFDTEVFKEITSPRMVALNDQNSVPVIDCGSNLLKNRNDVSFKKVIVENTTQGSHTTLTFYDHSKKKSIAEKNMPSNVVQVGLDQSHSCHNKYTKVDDNISLRDKVNIKNKAEQVVGTFKRKQHAVGIDTTVKRAKCVENKLLAQSVNGLRKTKYTKMVKNWLNEIDVTQEANCKDVLYDQDLIGFGEKNKDFVNNCGSTMITSDTNKTIAMEKKGKGSKKTVQAQLANKDGVMKFKKPKKSLDIGNTCGNSVQGEDKIVINKSNGEKITKPKFCPPVKSQTPLKEIGYNIDIVETKNITEILNLAKAENDNEKAALLIYTNGFCQLNRHHTDDSCVPDGILLLIDDKLFYLKGDNKSKFIEFWKELLQNKIVCYEGKEILIYIKSQCSLELNESINFYDIKIGSSLIDPDNPPENFSQLQKVLSFTPEFTIATKCTLQKSAWYLTLLKSCAQKLRTMLINADLWNVFMEIEMPLLPIIADMEWRGVHVDVEQMKTMENLLLEKMKQVEQECYKAAGKVFQINSAVQVRTILYDELKLDSKCNIKIRETFCKGAKSTSETMLRGLVPAHPLPKLILEYRHLHKAHGTFVAGVAQHVRAGVVRPVWVQTAAATGRIASSNPNLQAIPKTPLNLLMFPVDSQIDDQLLNLRSVYVAREGYVLLAADFKQIECRVFAHVAGDTTLLEALSSPDLFTVLAAKWTKKPEGDVSSADRERTKRTVYASLYGAGARTLADVLGVGYDRALAIAASFNRTFPSLKSFGREVVARCAAAAGRLATLSGRARCVPHIGSAEPALRSHAERQAVNFIIQGSAADICKVAMVRCARRLRLRPDVDARLLVQIHDELVWEVRRDHLTRAAELIVAEMSGCGAACGMRGALPVAARAGRSWGSLLSLPLPLGETNASGSNTT